MKPMLFAFDSLTDIVSNMIGVVVLLNLTAVLYQGSQQKTVELEVITSLTNKQPAFFYVNGDRLLSIDPAAIGVDLIRSTSGPLTPGRSIPALGDRLRVSYDQKIGFTLAPGATSAWDSIATLQDPTTPAGARIAGLDPGHMFAFVFVTDDAASYASLKGAHAFMRARGLTVGWMPVSGEHGAVLCESYQANCNYQAEGMIAPP